MKYEINAKRIKKLNNIPARSGNVIYWMSRDQRVSGNWALITALNFALEYWTKLTVVFNLYPSLGYATKRHYRFMLAGLEEVRSELAKLNIPLEILVGDAKSNLTEKIETTEASILVTDFSPLKHAKQHRKAIASKTTAAVYMVDAHNTVPVWEASKKQEYAAYTMRPKIQKFLPEFLEEFPQLKPLDNNIQQFKKPKSAIIDLLNQTKAKKYAPEITQFESGYKAAVSILDEFIRTKSKHYTNNRNDPNENVVSNLSPYLHFGQISSQEVALEVRAQLPADITESFLEELIVRKELSDNYCHYQPDYDNFNGFPDWAKKTLHEHREDAREFLYTLDEFEAGATHDDLWNAAQNQMIETGKMHGYLRMYWAKKILEWTESPEQAQEFAIILNDRYSLDGRDPNGYTGIAWSIGGVHDRAWTEREVYGKIRYMNYNGAKRKFDVNEFVSKYSKSENKNTI